MEDNAAASGSNCELANPAQMCQIASQTGVLLRQMRLSPGRECHREAVAGWGAVAELLVRAAGGNSWLGRRGKETGDAMADSHREEGAMAKVPGSYVKFGKECTFAA